MIIKCFRFLLGLNGASILRGLRLGLGEFVKGCFASLDAAHPRQSRMQNNCQRAWESIPEVSLDQILGERRAIIQLAAQKYEDGMLPVRDALVLLSILAVEKPKEVLEIGTYMGHTTHAVAENLPDALIHTVDLPLDFSEQQNFNSGPPKDDFHLIGRRIVGREFKGQPVERRIKQHFGDTATINFQEFGRPTFFFIDGSHTYEYCKQDSEKCYALCQESGIFLWHDCDVGHPGVIKFILEWRALGRNVQRIQDTAIAYWKTA